MLSTAKFSRTIHYTHDVKFSCSVVARWLSDGCVGGGPARRSKSSNVVWGWVGNSVLGCSGVFGALDGKVGCCVISSRGDFGGDLGCETGCEAGCEIVFLESSAFGCIGISTTGFVCEVGVRGGVLGGAVGCDFCGCCGCGGCDGAVDCCGICGFSSFSFFFLLSE